MSIVGRQARKSTRSTTPRRASSHRSSGFRQQRPNRFVRWLSRIPRWVLWLLSIGIALAYIIFILQVVLHFSMPWKAMYGDVPEPDGYNVRGVDISHYQKKINWDELRSSKLNDQPVRFVIIKATEGTTIFDNTFNSNFFHASQYGFIRGAYHFFIPGSNARRQAEFFLSQVHLRPGDLPPVLDIEKTGGLSRENLQEGVRTWLNIVRQHYGVRPIIYTNYAFKLKYLDTPEFNEYPFWIAHYYKDKLEYKGEWVMWQYTDCGRVGGINERVDCNVFNGSYSDLVNLCITEDQFPIGVE